MNKAIVAIVVGLALAAPACGAEHAPQKLEDLGGRRVRMDRDVVDVAISEADRNRVEVWTGLSDHAQHSVLTGPTWAQLFKGDPKSRPMFTITNSSVLEESIAGGSATRVTYSVDGTLSFAGRDYPVHSQASVSTGRSATHAFPAAVQKCVIIASRQVSSILAGDSDKPQPAGAQPEGPAPPK